MNTIYFLVQQTMFFSIPLLIVALGGMYSERSGVVNIALEGIMITGAFAGIFFINVFRLRCPASQS
jgi:general nucleoside transport system permease protein